MNPHLTLVTENKFMIMFDIFLQIPQGNFGFEVSISVSQIILAATSSILLDRDIIWLISKLSKQQGRAKNSSQC